MSERAVYWQQVVADWERSGLSQAEFCRRRGLAAVTFAWWKCRLRQLDGAGGAPRRSAGYVQRGGRADFVEVALPRPAAYGGFAYELALPGGACLRVAGDFEPERVARLLQVLAATFVEAVRRGVAAPQPDLAGHDGPGVRIGLAGAHLAGHRERHTSCNCRAGAAALRPGRAGDLVSAGGLNQPGRGGDIGTVTYYR